jgi:hypothetical protein
MLNFLQTILLFSTHHLWNCTTDLTLNYKDDNSGNLCLRLNQSSKTEKTCQIPSEKCSKIVTQYFDRIYEDTGSAEGWHDFGCGVSILSTVNPWAMHTWDV